MPGALADGAPTNSWLEGWAQCLARTHLPRGQAGDGPARGPGLSFQAWSRDLTIHLKREYFWLLAFHFRMRFKKWEGSAMGKLGFDHSNLFSPREIWVNIPRIPSTGLRALKKVNFIGSFGQM